MRGGPPSAQPLGHRGHILVELPRRHPREGTLRAALRRYYLLTDGVPAGKWLPEHVVPVSQAPLDGALSAAGRHALARAMILAGGIILSFEEVLWTVWGFVECWPTEGGPFAAGADRAFTEV